MSTRSSTSIAFREGWDAFREGQELNSNPYCDAWGQPLRDLRSTALEWIEGWRTAGIEGYRKTPKLTNANNEPQGGLSFGKGLL